MVSGDTNFFRIINNFEKTVNVDSVPIILSNTVVNPMVTIAIPTFKRTSLLKQALNSAIKQLDFFDYEILIVDNNPERECDTELFLTSNTFPKLNYYKNLQNIGMAGNWNRLFSLSNSDYVVMLHDDDILFPTFLKECFSLLVNCKTEIGILKPYSFPFKSIQEINSFAFESKLENCKLKEIKDLDNYANFIIGAPSGCVFKKKNVIDLGGFNQDYFPSLDFCFFVLFCNHFKVFIYQKYLSFYRLGFNESMNFSTINRFLHVDYYLKRQIMKKYYLPNFFVENEINFITKKYIKNYKKLFKGFVFKTHTLDLKTQNKFFTLLISIFIKFYIKIFSLSLKINQKT